MQIQVQKLKVLGGDKYKIGQLWWMRLYEKEGLPVNFIGSRKNDMMQSKSGPEQTGCEQKLKSQRSWVPQSPKTIDIQSSD